MVHNNLGGNHSIPSTVTSSFSSPSLSKSLSGHHLFPNLALPLPDTAFPFPPPPIFLSSLLPQPRVSPSWFAPPHLPPPPPPPPTSIQPLSLTTNDSKENSLKNDSISSQHKQLRKIHFSPERDPGTSIETRQIASPESSMNEKESNSINIPVTSRQHSDNLSWLADVAISSRAIGQQTTIGSPLHHRSSPVTSMDHCSLSMNAFRNGGLVNPANLSAETQRLYSPRFQPNNSIFHFQTSPTIPHPPSHLNSPFLNTYTFSPTAQNQISPFIVPNSSNVPTSRSIEYQTGIPDHHYNHHLLNVSNPAFQSNSALPNNNSRSPSIHSSESPTILSSGSYSSPTISAGSPDEAKSLSVRLSKDSQSSPQPDNEIEITHPTANCGIKRKSPNSSELNNNVYKIPSGKEGSLKHRILKPPNINIVKNNSAEYNSDAPFSAPPIPGARKEEFFKKVPYSNPYIAPHHNDAHPFANESILSQQRRKSVPQSLTSNSLADRKSHLNGSSSSKLNQQNSAPAQSYSHLQYPIYFHKGSIIQLANGKVKKVEEMSTQDFIESAVQSPDLCADSSVVIKIEQKLINRSALLTFLVGKGKVQVNVEAPLEHPFFVFHQGWSSCSPDLSLQRYGLKCRKLIVNDVCVSLTPKTKSSKANSNDKNGKNKTFGSSSERIQNGNLRKFNSLETNLINDKKQSLEVELENKVKIKNVPIKRNRRYSAPESFSE